MKTKFHRRTFLNRSLFLAAAILSFVSLTSPAQDYRVLRHFAGGNNDGAGPYGSLIESSSTLYGMTCNGGSNNIGTIFRMNTDGTGFAVIHSFVSAATDGQRPYGSLLQSGSILYAMAASENTSYGGTLFQIGTNGAGFQVLRSFSTSDGVWPYDSLIQSGSILFGLNTYGGNASGWSGKGTIFQFNTNDRSFKKLRTFLGSPGDGNAPHGTLLQSGSNLFGTTLWGGINDLGTVFKINTDGSVFQLLHSFAGGTNDGSKPYGSLILSGSSLYGTTGYGGISNLGTIFKINTDGSGFQLLHGFPGGVNDGSKPGGSLILSGSNLYGVTGQGGISNQGTIFKINTNGSGFQLLHSFAGGSNDGSKPGGLLTLSGSMLCGMTTQGGSNNLGVIFALDIIPKLAISLNDTNVNLSWSTNFPEFALESTEQLAGAWTPVPDVTGYSVTLPVNADSQFFRLRK